MSMEFFGKYYKLTNEKEVHYDFKYKTGVNVDPLEFSWKGSCCPGVLYFSDNDNILKFLDIGSKSSRWIREVRVLSDEEVVRDSSYNGCTPKWRAKSLECGERKDLLKVDTWKWMYDRGLIKYYNLKSILDWCVYCGTLNVLKYIISVMELKSVYVYDYDCSLTPLNLHLHGAITRDKCDIAKWLIERYKHKVDFDDVINVCCDYSKLDMLKFIFRVGKNNISIGSVPSYLDNIRVWESVGVVRFLLSNTNDKCKSHVKPVNKIYLDFFGFLCRFIS